MQAHDLRSVLLIQAVEENDRAGELLAHAERIEATRAALRAERKPLDSLVASEMTPAALRFLARRAERLMERLIARAPAISQLSTLAQGSTWMARIGLLLAFVFGLSLAALDGSRRIDIVAFPLLGLISWNLAVYLLLALGLLRRGSGSHKAGRPLFSALYQAWLTWRARLQLGRSSQFNAPVSAALRHFTDRWLAIAQPLLLLRAKRLLHTGAALLLLGLLAGLYVRGIALRYEAGWESTFLGPSAIRALLRVMYGPASALSGIALPDSNEAVRALRWDIGGGVDAAPFIHLMAWTGALYVLIPRLWLALVASLELWQRSRKLAVPPDLAMYARGLLLDAGESGELQGTAIVWPYAYAPSQASLDGLQAVLKATLGTSARSEVRAPIAYGDEDTLREALSRDVRKDAHKGGDWNVLLMSLAATPERENHGAVIAALQQSVSLQGGESPLLVVVDEASYAARMQGDTSLEPRLEERRRLWRELVAGHGVSACILDLSRLSNDDTGRARARNALHSALFRPREVQVS